MALSTKRDQLGILDVSKDSGAWGSENKTWYPLYIVPSSRNAILSTYMITNSSRLKRAVGLRIVTGWDGTTYPIPDMSDGQNVIPLGKEVNAYGTIRGTEGLTLNEGGAIVGWSDSPISSITSITHSGTTATATTSSAHNLLTDDKVYVYNASPFDYNGLFTVTVTGEETFTYVMEETPGSDASGTIYCIMAGLGMAVYGREDSL